MAEVAAGQRSGRGDARAAQAQEAAQLLKRAAGAERIIALDERGTMIDSEGMARELRTWLDGVPRVALLVGGADGLTDDVRQRSDQVWSLSGLTLPHALVRVLLAEQLYRAWTIVQGHPYHRGSAG